MVVLREISEGSSSSLSTPDHPYDVYLSFRGADTRYSFIDHLYNALTIANIKTFLDDEEIETGLTLESELKSAIRKSRASIIVLSKNYASSTWCLEELVSILEQHMNFNQIVIPIFYHAEPTHVRKQQGTFGDAMEKHKQRIKAETNVDKRSHMVQKMELWMKALTQIADLKGHDARGRRETEFIAEIVTDIHSRLSVPSISNTRSLLIGMDYDRDHNHKYDVFLSFLGADTRNNFTYHLYNALVDANVETFFDYDKIETGPTLKPELESAIKASKACVIVLSKNYASSSWCLEELVLILEQYTNFKQIAIPIFYHVERTHVRKQQSTFGDAMKKHEQRINAENRSQLTQKMVLWKKALTLVADLKGYDAKGRLETDFIEEITKDIQHQVGVHLRSTLPNPIGVDYPIYFITSWLKDGSTHTTDILTISGKDGIGKTSLALHIYNLNSHLFQKSSFIDDISTKCSDQYDKLHDLQKKLLEDISNKTLLQLSDVSVCTSMIENALIHEKVFLVLDDIDSLDQLYGLLGNKGFHSGSKVIITTREALVTESYKLCNPILQLKHMTLVLDRLNETSSLQLLISRAFKRIDPREGYNQVSKKLAKLCQGHPLSLKVLGSSLCDQDVTEWEEYIEELEKVTDYHTRKILQMSFDSLPSQNDKELFKHIACFFNGMDRDYTETILKACGILTLLGIKNLLDRCLLKIGPRNELVMHQSIQAFGRDVVLQESLEKPWKRSRLWCHEESYKVLKEKKGKGNLKGIIVDTRMLKKEELHGLSQLETDALSKMDNLMLLQLNYVHLNGTYNNFPKKLRWLCMHGFPLQSLPLDLPMANLVALDMSYSNFESFDMSYSNFESLDMSCSNMEQPSRRRKLNGSCIKDKGLLRPLKILNLSFCYQLCRVGGFSQLPRLEKLILTSCTGLIEISESIEECVELVLIDVSYCHKLKKLAISIAKLKNVKTLLLDGCNVDFPNITEAIPRASKHLAISLPSSLASLSLRGNNLSNESFPNDFSSLSMLKELYLDGNPIVSLPDSVRNLTRLEKLSMCDCDMLISIVHPPSTLRQLILKFDSLSYHKPLLQKIVFDPEMSPLELSVPFHLLAPSSFEIEGIIKIQPMAGVEEKILHCLGWTDIELLKRRLLRTFYLSRGSEEHIIQMYFEFGIFSTIYGGKEIPNWINQRRKGPSLSFTMPLTPNKLRGLNICYVQTFQIPDGMFQLPSIQLFHLPLIIVTNKTKNHTWIYRHYIKSVFVDEDEDEKCLIFLSYWMFGMNDMESGDQVAITVTEKRDQVTSECGISLVYDDGSIEEDPLGYYKSWNHIIGGDLSAFQVTTGPYILDNERFTWHSRTIGSYYRPIIEHGSSYKEHVVRFRAFSQR